MTELINNHPTLAWIILFAACVAVVVACVALFNRSSERRQARMLGRLRRDSEEQAQSILQLGENLNATLRQVESLSAAMEARQDRLRRSLDERMELLTQANDRKLEQMRETVSEKLDVLSGGQQSTGQRTSGIG